jgi:hypothetical protein
MRPTLHQEGIRDTFTVRAEGNPPLLDPDVVEIGEEIVMTP